MKTVVRTFARPFSALLLAVALGSAVTSCDPVLSEEAEDCAVYVRFKYDYNMKFADAFQNEVNSVSLYAFDKSGTLAFYKMESGDVLKQDGYRMRLDDISHSDKAEYDFIVWAGEPHNKSFSFDPMLTVGVSTKEDLWCKLNRPSGRAEDDAVEITDDLQPLFHGQVEDLSFGRSVSAGEEVVVSLVKNTNVIKVILMQQDGVRIDVSKFDFSITDDNGLMDYDNSLLEDVTLTYLPYYRAEGSTSEDGEEETDNFSIAMAQLTVARLVETQNPRLTITNTETGEEVLNVKLIKLLKLTEAEGHDMSLQEYLDRQDEYSLTFFLDRNMQWISTRIMINDWVVRFNDFKDI